MSSSSQQEAFEAWYASYDTRTPQDPFDRWLAQKAWDAAMQSPEVQALMKALKVLVDNGGIGPESMFEDARDALAAMEKKAMNKLFSDLKTDKEKSAFFLSGRAHETGIIALAIQNDVAMAYHRCAEYAKEVQALRNALQEVVDAADGDGWKVLDPSLEKQRAALAAMEKQK